MGKNKDLISNLTNSIDEGAAKAPDNARADRRDRSSRPGQRNGYLADRERTMADQSARVYAVQRLVDPSECRVWARHNRFYDYLSEERCQDLIDSIRTEGRQLQPAIVRELSEPTEEGVRFEIIAGARRHWAVSWLRRVEKLDVPYFVEVREMTDEQAFLLSDSENRDRQDLTDYERALDYKRALDEFYEGRVATLCQKLSLSRQHLYRLLFLADMPEVVIEALGGFLEINERMVRPLKPLLDDAGKRKEVIGRAEVIAAEQLRAKAGEGASIAPATAMRYLLGKQEKTPEVPNLEVTDSSGHRLAWVTRQNGTALAIQVDRRVVRSKEEMRYAIDSLIERIYRT